MSFKRRKQRSEAEAEQARRLDRLEDRFFLALLTIIGALLAALLSVFGNALVAVLFR